VLHLHGVKGVSARVSMRDSGESGKGGGARGPANRRVIKLVVGYGERKEKKHARGLSVFCLTKNKRVLVCKKSVERQQICRRPKTEGREEESLRGNLQNNHNKTKEKGRYRRQLLQPAEPRK